MAQYHDVGPVARQLGLLAIYGVKFTRSAMLDSLGLVVLRHLENWLVLFAHPFGWCLAELPIVCLAPSIRVRALIHNVGRLANRHRLVVGGPFHS